jgi:hypothetical protein
MHSVSRRGFLVLGGTGAAGAALASCGGKTTERDQSDDAALLEAAHGAETSLGAAYGAAIKAAKPQQAAALNQFRGASAKRASRLVQLVTDAGGEPSVGDSGSGSPIESANGAIAAYRAGAGPLSSEQDRGTMIAFLAAVAAELSVLSEVDDAQPVPHAFVTGGEQAPLEPAGETTTTTDTTTTGDGQ